MTQPHVPPIHHSLFDRRISSLLTEKTRPVSAGVMKTPGLGGQLLKNSLTITIYVLESYGRDVALRRLSAQIRKSQMNLFLFRSEQNEGRIRGLARCSCLGNTGSTCGNKKSPVWKGTSPSSDPKKPTGCFQCSLIFRKRTFRAAWSQWANIPRFSMRRPELSKKVQKKGRGPVMITCGGHLWQPGQLTIGWSSVYQGQ
jgi:hypothetical protein